MRDVFVIANDGTRLMPTTRYRARKLLNADKAVICKYRPFTIQLTRTSEKNVQPIELCMDTGSEHIGISVKSEKHEYVHVQYDNLSDEKLRHQDQMTYRCTRRNRKRYRKPRFNNRRRTEGWLAPTNQHKIENHQRLIDMYIDTCLITNIVLEVGQFDPAAMQEFEETGVVLTGVDYQRGKQYQLANLREAVFVRDQYKCRICHKGVEDGKVLHVHHIVPRSSGGTDRINNLMTVCTNHHTSAAHKPGGVLYGLRPITGTFKDATFMNVMRWRLVDSVREKYPDITVLHTYGSYTKANRRMLGRLVKTHANDAYAMGEYHPKHRHCEEHYKKRRRNNRVLAKFYDAKYIDVRDNKKKFGLQLGCNRTNRSVPRNNPNNERMFRGVKISKGRVSIRKQHYTIQPGDVLKYRGSITKVRGVHCHGTRVMLETGKSVNITDVTLVRRIGGWQFLSVL